MCAQLKDKSAAIKLQLASNQPQGIVRYSFPINGCGHRRRHRRRQLGECANAFARAHIKLKSSNVCTVHEFIGKTNEAKWNEKKSQKTGFVSQAFRKASPANRLHLLRSLPLQISLSVRHRCKRKTVNGQRANAHNGQPQHVYRCMHR